MKFTKILKNTAALLLVLLMLFAAVSCDLLNEIGKIIEDLPTETPYSTETPATSADTPMPTTETPMPSTDTPAPSTDTPAAPTETPVNRITVEQNGKYYDLEHVVMYLHTYGKLPANYITKTAAGELGWTGGTPERFVKGFAIGGDYFGNGEKLLPTNTKYNECDLETLGADGRGAKRLVYSKDKHYYYSDDHYESFREVIVTEKGEVKFK